MAKPVMDNVDLLDEIDVKYTGCGCGCGIVCPLKVYAQNDRISQIDPVPGQQLCVKGRNWLTQVYSPERLKFPMKRVDERGKGTFERISWDEALETIARKTRETINKHGPESILVYPRRGEDTLLNKALAYRLFGLLGGYTYTRGSLCIANKMVASKYTYGTISSESDFSTCLHSNLIIIWGYNLAETNRRGNDAVPILTKAREKGARVVVVDPVKSATALHADQWIPIRPGTDACMLLAMAKVIINEEFYSKEFVEKYVSGFEQFKEHVQKYDLEYAEKITGVPAKIIADLAREYASNQPAALFAGDGPTRIGSQPGQYLRAAMALAIIVGSFANPGTNPAGAVGFDKELSAEAITEVDGAKIATVPEPKLADAILLGTAGGYASDIKMGYFGFTNMVSQHGNSNKVVKALQKLDFLVVNDLFMTPTARYADILLPATTIFERTDVSTYRFYGRSIIYLPKIIEPLYECKSQLQIFQELSQKLNISEQFHADWDEENWLDEIIKVASTEKSWLKDLSLERLKKEHVVEVGPENFLPFQEQINEGKPFSTRSGKIELYSSEMAERNLPPLPTYLEDWENPWHPIAATFPLQIVTPHTMYRMHSMFANNPVTSKAHKINGLEPVWINPKDSEKRNIFDGDIVKVFNKRGAFLGRAKVTDRVTPGVISVYEGGWFNPSSYGVDMGGCVNSVTQDDLDPIGDSAVFNSVMVDVMRWENTEERKEQ